MSDVDLLLIDPYRRDSEYLSAVQRGCGGPEWHRRRLPTPGKICSDTNLGVLSLATYAEARGLCAKILTLSGDPCPVEAAIRCVATLRPRVVGLSCMFHTTYLALLELVSAIKQEFPESVCVSGGPHIAQFPYAALAEIPGLDGVCVGEAESIIYDLCSRPCTKWGELRGMVVRNGKRLDILSDGVKTSTDPPRVTIDFPLRHNLYPGSGAVLVLEESRGCPLQCAYCCHEWHYRTKPLNLLRDELYDFLDTAHCDHPEVIVAADTFGFSATRTAAIVEILETAQHRRAFTWGTQTRVECRFFHDAANRSLLEKSGLRSLSVGLESASPRILRLMNKCKDPTAYLRSAEALVRAMGNAHSPINLRLNILVYAGEDHRTLSDTCGFLERHQNHVAGIHTAVVHAYPGTPLWTQLPKLRSVFGTQPVRSDYWDRVHAYPLHPSSDLRFDEAEDIARSMREKFTRTKPESEVQP